MTLEGARLDKQVGLQDIAIAKGRGGGDLVVLTVYAADDPEGRV
jgi:hypothetical protein